MDTKDTENKEKIQQEQDLELAETSLEQLLYNLRIKNNYSYVEVVNKLNDDTLTEKKVKKWEKGLEYPDLNMIYKISEMYNIPSEILVQAKNYSFNKGLASIKMILIKWICYLLDVSIKAGIAIVYTTIILLLIITFFVFVSLCHTV